MSGQFQTEKMPKIAPKSSKYIGSSQHKCDKRQFLQRSSINRAGPIALSPTNNDTFASHPLDNSALTELPSGYSFSKVSLYATSPMDKSDPVVDLRSSLNEREASHATDSITHRPKIHTPLIMPSAPSLFSIQCLIQRFPDEEGLEEVDQSDYESDSDEGVTESDLDQAESEAETSEEPPSELIVEDDVSDIAPVQMYKSDFLAQLQVDISDVIPDNLTGVIEDKIDFYSDKDSQLLETDIHNDIPGTTEATAASDYIPAIRERVAQALANGEIGQSESSSEDVSFKGREGGPHLSISPQAVKQALGSGTPLNGREKTRMESAFGRNFSQVRIHTDSKAASLSKSLNARAFTIGRDVAFGSGEYQPGTLMGDALIAHELAHVVQQSSADTTIKSSKIGGSKYTSLEEDADRSAFGVVSSIWTGMTSAFSGIVQNIFPTLRSGVRLSRCDGCSSGPVGSRADGGGASAAASAALPAPQSSLANSARALGREALTMESYRNFQNRTWGWFFSPNNTLAGMVVKPPNFNTWDDWSNLNWRAREIIANLAEIDARTLRKGNAGQLSKLKDAYAKWPSSRYAIFQSATSEDTNTCNIFLGDALFLNGINKVNGGKYYSANQVYNQQGGFSMIDKAAVALGDIAAWGGHVGIVTQVVRAEDRFCAAEGYREPIGGEACVKSSDPSKYKISNPNLRFLRY